MKTNLDLNNPLHELIVFSCLLTISILFVGAIIGLTFLAQHFLS